MPVESGLYEQLGVGGDASPDEIRRSYRQAALRWHPDRNPHDPNAADNFKACLEAYEVLSDPDRRAAYDHFGLAGSRSSASASSQPQPHQHQQQQQYSTFATFVHPAPATPFSFSGPFWDPFDTQGFQSFRASAPAPPPTAPDNGQLPRGLPNDARGHSATWSFQMSSSSSSTHAADGTYSTQFHTWNNVDGHRSGSRSGTIGDGGGPALPNGFMPPFAGFNNNFFSSFGFGPGNLFMGTNMNTGPGGAHQRLHGFQGNQRWA